MRQFIQRRVRRTQSSRPRTWVTPPEDHAAMLREIFEANLWLRGIGRMMPVPAPARRRAA